MFKNKANFTRQTRFCRFSENEINVEAVSLVLPNIFTWHPQHVEYNAMVTKLQDSLHPFLIVLFSDEHCFQ